MSTEWEDLQLWKQYLPKTKISFLEYDAACAMKHKANIEAKSKGTLFIGTYWSRVKALHYRVILAAL